MYRMLKDVIVVEGKQDIQAVKRAVDAECIATGGFGLGPRVLERVAQAMRHRGVIILTDPDSAGERIRRYLSNHFPEARHAFIPKEEAQAAGDIGVENASPESIRTALEKVRVEQWQPEEPFVWSDMLQAGLTAHPEAAKRRALLGAALGIGYANAKTFFYRLNHYGITVEEFWAAVAAGEELKSC